MFVSVIPWSRNLNRCACSQKKCASMLWLGMSIYKFSSSFFSLNLSVTLNFFILNCDIRYDVALFLAHRKTSLGEVVRRITDVVYKSIFICYFHDLFNSWVGNLLLFQFVILFIRVISFLHCCSRKSGWGLSGMGLKKMSGWMSGRLSASNPFRWSPQNAEALSKEILSCVSR